VVSLPAAHQAPPRRWRLRGRFPEGDLAVAPYPPLIRHLLWHRGIRTAAEAAALLDATPVVHDPSLLPDITPALDRLGRAVREGERVAVYGDFDVDGVTASAILIEGLRGLYDETDHRSERVTAYIPDRFSEGYGVNTAAIDSLAKEGVTLIITADCGTSSVVEVEHATRSCIDVIVVDHHTVPPELPAAVAIVNPKRLENRYLDVELASGGLAFKLMSALYAALGRAYSGERYLDLVALSTICDVAPLRDENRSLVREGIAALARADRPGLRALLEVAGVDPARVDADTIGYTLGPRLNAAGRLAHAGLALDLLLENDPDRAMQRALELSALNHQRQQATIAAMDLARGRLAEQDAGAPLIFLGHPDIPAGIVGLVAGRLAEEYYRPAVVYQREAETSRASCRSIPEFDITAALRRTPELMVRFGGHRAAAGFTAANDKLPSLKQALLETASEELAGVELAPVLDIDADIALRHLNGKLIEWLSRLAPFGCANPEPTFLSRDVEVLDAWNMGEDGSHLRLKLRDGRVSYPAVAFYRGAGICDPEAAGDEPPPPPVSPGDRIDIVYSLTRDRGAEGALQLRLADFRPAGAG
jgi:single-stranded-DNA-specific exonuclease